MEVSFVKITQVTDVYYDLNIKVSGMEFVSCTYWTKENLQHKFGFTEEVFQELLNS